MVSVCLRVQSLIQSTVVMYSVSNHATSQPGYYIEPRHICRMESTKCIRLYNIDITRLWSSYRASKLQNSRFQPSTPIASFFLFLCVGRRHHHPASFTSDCRCETQMNKRSENDTKTDEYLYLKKRKIIRISSPSFYKKSRKMMTAAAAPVPPFCYTQSSGRFFRKRIDRSIRFQTPLQPNQPSNEESPTVILFLL
jgi:hypothetical protein